MRTTILPSVSSLTTVSASKLDASYADGTSTAWTTVGVVIAVGRGAHRRPGGAPALPVSPLPAAGEPRARRRDAGRGRPRDHGGDSALGRGGSPEGGQAGRLRLHPRPHPGTRGELRRQRGREQVPGRPGPRRAVPAGVPRQIAAARRRRERRHLRLRRSARHRHPRLRRRQQRRAVRRLPGRGVPQHHVPGERAAAVRTLLAYQVYERDDRKLRALAKTNLAAAVAFDIGTAPGQSDAAFNAYDADLSSVIAINSAAFADAIQAGQGDTATWNLAFPVAGAALLAALVLAGVRRRLAEYH